MQKASQNICKIVMHAMEHVAHWSVCIVYGLFIYVDMVIHGYQFDFALCLLI